MGNEGITAFTGFVANTHDALILFEACRRGLLPRTPARLSENQRKAIKSGDIFVFSEDESKIKRWTDGRRWSPSRILNNFLIYRELDPQDSTTPPISEQNQSPFQLGGGTDTSNGKDFNQGASGTSTPFSTLSDDGTVRLGSQNTNTSDNPNLSPDHGQHGHSQTSTIGEGPRSSIVSGPEEPKRATVGNLGPSGKVKDGGFVKKTISVAGLHMISYYDTEDVVHGRLPTPESVPELANVEISHEFLLAQYFRHPPQVAFGNDGLPRFAGLTDEEPMVRRPPQNQRRPRSDSDRTMGTMSTMSPTSRYPPYMGPAHPVTTGVEAALSTPASYHDSSAAYRGINKLPTPPSNIHQHQQPLYPVADDPRSMYASPPHPWSDPSRPTASPLMPTSSGLTRSATSLSSKSEGSDSMSMSSPRQHSFSKAHRHDPYRLPPSRSGSNAGLPIQTPDQPAYGYADYTSVPTAPFHPANPHPSQSYAHEELRHFRSTSLQEGASFPTDGRNATSYPPQEHTPVVRSVASMPGQENQVLPEHMATQISDTPRPSTSPSHFAQPYSRSLSMPSPHGHEHFMQPQGQPVAMMSGQGHFGPPADAGGAHPTSPYSTQSPGFVHRPSPSLTNRLTSYSMSSRFSPSQAASASMSPLGVSEPPQYLPPPTTYGNRSYSIPGGMTNKYTMERVLEATPGSIQNDPNTFIPSAHPYPSPSISNPEFHGVQGNPPGFGFSPHDTPHTMGNQPYAEHQGYSTGPGPNAPLVSPGVESAASISPTYDAFNYSATSHAPQAHF